MLLSACAGAPEPARPQALDTVEPEREFHLLLGEVALQRGRMAQSAEHYAAAAAIDERPEIARQATLIAYEAQRFDTALQAARRWEELAPDSAEAQRYLGALSLRHADDALASQHLLRSLEYSRERGAAFSEILSLLAAEPRRRSAARVMEGLVRRHPGEPRGEYALAQLALQGGQPELALGAAERLHELAAQWVEARLTLARALVANQRYEEAAEVALSLAADEGDPDLHRALASLLLEADRAEDAYDLLLAAREIDPGDTELTRALGLVELHRGNLDAAYGYFNELRQREQYRAEAHYYLGFIEQERERWLQATRNYSRVTTGEHVLDAQNRVSRILRDTAGLEAARSHLQNFRSASPAHADSMVVLEAQLLLDAQLGSEALALFEEPLQDRPDSETLRQGRAGVFAALARRASEAGDVSAAMRWYRDGLRAHPDDSLLLYQRALLYVQQGQVRRTVRELERLVAQEPDSPVFLNALGYVLADQTRDYERAHELIEEALERAPHDPATLDSKGWVLYRLGDLDGAVDYLRRAWYGLRDPEVAAHLIEVHLARGEETQARQMLERALESWPEDGHLEPWRERLQE